MIILSIRLKLQLAVKSSIISFYNKTLFLVKVVNPKKIKNEKSIYIKGLGYISSIKKSEKAPIVMEIISAIK